jgi:hypothetical protein
MHVQYLTLALFELFNFTSGVSDRQDQPTSMKIALASVLSRRDDEAHWHPLRQSRTRLSQQMSVARTHL